MSESVVIRTPIPTPEEMADSLGIPRSRLKWLRSLLIEQGSIKPSKAASARRSSSTPRAHLRTSAVRASGSAAKTATSSNGKFSTQTKHPKAHAPYVNEPVLITFPIPTPEEVADSLGVPRSRIKWCVRFCVNKEVFLSRKKPTPASRPP